MFKITRKKDNRLDIQMSGKLNAENMQKAFDELIDKSDGIENGKMLYDIVEYRLPSLDAIILEFSRMSEMRGFIRKFKRAAVLTDKKWLKAISELEGRLIPGLTIKAFRREDKANAEKWLESHDDLI